MLDTNDSPVIEAQATNVILRSLPLSELHFLIPHFESVRIEAGAGISDQGGYVFFIESGIVTLSSSKNDLCLGFVGSEGMLGIFGGMGLGEEPFRATALTEVKGQRISATDFERAIADLPAARRAVLEYMRVVMAELAAEVYAVATNRYVHVWPAGSWPSQSAARQSPWLSRLYRCKFSRRSPRGSDGLVAYSRRAQGRSLQERRHSRLRYRDTSRNRGWSIVPLRLSTT